jgi:dipeptidase E
VRYTRIMKLYLSSIRIPVPEELSKLIGKPLAQVSVALIPNAKDYFTERPRNIVVNDLVSYMSQLGLKVDIIDLREFSENQNLKSTLANYDLVWAMGGNTYMLRYEVQRSGFDKIIRDLLEEGVVYGGDSAGALVAGSSIAGVELADEPAFAERVIKDGMNLVPFVIMPHADNPEFAVIMPIVRKMHKRMIELKDSQAIIFNGDKHWLVEQGITNGKSQ